MNLVGSLARRRPLRPLLPLQPHLMCSLRMLMDQREVLALALTAAAAAVAVAAPVLQLASESLQAAVPGRELEPDIPCASATSFLIITSQEA